MGLESLFGGKKHTKKEYQKLEEEMKLLENTRRIYQFNDPRGQEPQEPTRMRAEVRKDMEKMYAKGQAEAIKTNEKYDKLSTDTKDAEDLKKLKEKLGM